MKEKKWAMDLKSVKSEVIRFCPKCNKQSYYASLNRHGVILTAECVLCGHKK